MAGTKADVGQGGNPQFPGGDRGQSVFRYERTIPPIEHPTKHAMVSKIMSTTQANKPVSRERLPIFLE
jgi:hypothetical protein